MNFELMKFGMGLEPDAPDERDLTTKTFGLSASNISDVIELPLPTEILNQDDSLMCAAFSAGRMVSMLNGTEERFSECDLYAHKGTPGEGSILRNIMKTLQKRGMSTAMVYNHKGTYEECLDNYEENKDRSDFYAEIGRIRHYYAIKTFDDCVATLELGNPFILGVTVRSNFVPDEDGIIQMPEGTNYGGHAIVGVGSRVRDGIEEIKILNSWGKAWGINGTAWIPFAMIFSAWGAIDANMKVQNIYFQIGEKYYSKNGVRVPMDVAPFIENGRTWVPLRFAVEACDKEVEWWANSQTIYIKG